MSLVDLDKSVVIDLFRLTVGECLRNCSTINVTVFRQNRLEIPLQVPPAVFESSAVKTSRRLPSYTCLESSSTLEGTETSEQYRSDVGRLLSRCGGQDCIECGRVSEGGDCVMKSSEKRSGEFLGCGDILRRPESLPLSELRLENGTRIPYEDIVPVILNISIVLSV